MACLFFLQKIVGKKIFPTKQRISGKISYKNMLFFKKNNILKEKRRVSMNKIYVLDTNVLLLDPHSLLAFEDRDVIVPLKVIE